MAVDEGFEDELARLAWEVTLAFPPAPPGVLTYNKFSLSLRSVTEAEQPRPGQGDVLGIAALCKREGAQEPGASPSAQTGEKARNWESYTRAHFPRQFKVIDQILQDNAGGQAAHCMQKSVDRPFDDRRWTALHWAAFGGHKGGHILKSEYYGDFP